MTTWRDAVWAAVQRQSRLGNTFTRQQFIAAELDSIVAEIGAVGATPAQTLSRVLQELRDDGVLIFDGQGQYRIAEDIADETVDAAVATEQWKLHKARIGQGPFRSALMARWEAKCPLTGIKEPALLRASHIVPWNRCESDAERLNPDNGLLLSALWDAAFDRGLVTFGDDGRVVPLAGLSASSLSTIRGDGMALLLGLTEGNRVRLRWHRDRYQAAV